MSRKDLKKKINTVMELLYADCVFYKVFVVDADKAAADKIIESIANVHSDFLKRISVNEGKGVKGRTKSYYKKLTTDFKEKVDELGDKISKLP